MATAPGHFGKALEIASAPGAHMATSSRAKTTLKGYSSGLSKFIEYIESTGKEFDERLRIKRNDVYGFITWAGRSGVEVGIPPKRKIASKTIDKYIDGIQAWHLVRHQHKETGDGSTTIPTTRLLCWKVTGSRIRRCHRSDILLGFDETRRSVPGDKRGRSHIEAAYRVW